MSEHKNSSKNCHYCSEQLTNKNTSHLAPTMCYDCVEKLLNAQIKALSKHQEETTQPLVPN